MTQIGIEPDPLAMSSVLLPFLSPMFLATLVLMVGFCHATPIPHFCVALVSAAYSLIVVMGRSLVVATRGL